MSLVGSIVLSRSGRDKGMYFAIIGENDTHLILADGRHRRIENPKHKKPKHVEVLNKALESNLKDLLLKGEVTNKMLWRAIKESLNS
ncbi:MAG: KOW domain-containing RNA-binding protein [Clostridia bacterium]|nr:KOW domain-containing RNA-binding protein [Clostridia bacterium]